MPSKSYVLVKAKGRLCGFGPTGGRFRLLLKKVSGLASKDSLESKVLVLNASVKTFQFSGRTSFSLGNVRPCLCLSGFDVLRRLVAAAAGGAPLGRTLGCAGILGLNCSRGAFSFATTAVGCSTSRLVLCS